MIPQSIHGSYLRWLVQRGWNINAINFAVALATKNIETTAHSNLRRATIMIGGVPRNGKTILAKTLSHETGMPVIHTDMHRFLYGRIENIEERLKAKKYYLKVLIEAFEGSVIIEGATLISDKGSGNADRVAFMVAREKDAHLYFLGCSECQPEDKLFTTKRYAKSHDCWTNRLDEMDRSEFIKRLPGRSRRLRDLCEVYNVKYFEIGTSTFFDDVTNAGNTILREVFQDEADS